MESDSTVDVSSAKRRMREEKEPSHSPLSLDNIITRLSKERKQSTHALPTHGDDKKTEHILLVSQTNNACLSISSSEDELDEGEPDLHQCGHCKLMFDNLRKYFVHKLQKVCRQPDVDHASVGLHTPASSCSVSEDGTKERFNREEEEKENNEMANYTDIRNNQIAVKRKNRKGLARRIKPAGEKEADAEIAETDTSSKDDVTEELDEVVTSLPDDVISDGSPVAAEAEKEATFNDTKSSVSDPSADKLEYFSEAQYNNEHFDRVPANLPHVMSTLPGQIKRPSYTPSPPPLMGETAEAVPPTSWSSHFGKKVESAAPTPPYLMQRPQLTPGRHFEKVATTTTTRQDSKESDLYEAKVTLSDKLDDDSPIEADTLVIDNEVKNEQSVNNEHADPADPPTPMGSHEDLLKYHVMGSHDDFSKFNSMGSHDDLSKYSMARKAEGEGWISSRHLLSEAAIERLITEPGGNPGDPSWKHAKQVYRCPLCAKVFPFKSKLQRHVLVHTGIKPYKCTVCGRGFTQQIDLQRHLTRHTGEKPFKCHLCKAQFIRADNLRKHCKDAHYVSIEEPIRKRRRKTTGSDTVLPPLEVAIALALSETERNGGKVLGRVTSRPAQQQANGGQQPANKRETKESSRSPTRSNAPTYLGGTYPQNAQQEVGAYRRSPVESYQRPPPSGFPGMRPEYARRSRSPPSAGRAYHPSASGYPANNPMGSSDSLAGLDRDHPRGEYNDREHFGKSTREHHGSSFERDQEKSRHNFMPRLHASQQQAGRPGHPDRSPSQIYMARRDDHHSSRFAEYARGREDFTRKPPSFTSPDSQKYFQHKQEFSKPPLHGASRFFSPPGSDAEKSAYMRTAASYDNLSAFREKPSINYGDFSRQQQRSTSSKYPGYDSSYFLDGSSCRSPPNMTARRHITQSQPNLPTTSPLNSVNPPPQWASESRQSPFEHLNRSAPAESPSAVAVLNTTDKKDVTTPTSEENYDENVYVDDQEIPVVRPNDSGTNC